jgi:hypothetical protein
MISSSLLISAPSGISTVRSPAVSAAMIRDTDLKPIARAERVTACPLTREAGTVRTYAPWALVRTESWSSPIPTEAPTIGSPDFSEVTLPRKVALWARAGTTETALKVSAVSPVPMVRRNEKPIILGFLGEEVGTCMNTAAGTWFRAGLIN